MAHNSTLLEEAGYPRGVADSMAIDISATDVSGREPANSALRDVASHPSAKSGPDAGRLTTVRFFDGNVHRILALALVEALVIWAAARGASAAVSGMAGMAGMTGMPGWPVAAGLSWNAELFVPAVMLAALSSMGLYQLRQRAPFTGILSRLMVGVGAGAVALELLFHVLAMPFVGHGVFLLAGALAFAGLASVRYAFSRVVDQDFFKRRVLVWGAGDRASTIGARLRRRTDQRGFRIVGYVNSPAEEIRVPAGRLVGRGQDLVDFVVRERIHEIVMAMDDRRRGFPEEFLRDCRRRGVVVCDIEQFLERETGRVSVELARPSRLIYAHGFRSDFVRNAIKRAFDVAASLALLAVALPAMLLAVLAIKIEDRGPVFYRQVRTGQGGRPFRIIKFRSMSVDAESPGKAVWAVRNDPRVTRVGEFIRKTRIDELPQVFNVLVGDMSFVGPRPERPEFVQSLERTIPFYAERHFVKPGITGWAQVRYPYGASEDDAREKLGYDLYYVMKHNLVFDIMVLLQTVEIVLFRIGSR